MSSLTPISTLETAQMLKKCQTHQYFFYHIKFNIWIGTDHPKNNYRTWFHFSIQGPAKGTQLTFKIKNMQNQVFFY